MRRADDVAHRQQRIVRIQHRLFLIHIDRGHAGPPGRKAATSAPGSISGARLVLTRSAVGFMRAKSAAVTMSRVAVTSRMCREMTSQSAKNCFFARRDRIAVGARLFERSGARPDQHRHAERPAVAGDDAADAAVAVNPERLAAQRLADADLPLAPL